MAGAGAGTAYMGGAVGGVAAAVQLRAVRAAVDTVAETPGQEAKKAIAALAQLDKTTGDKVKATANTAAETISSTASAAAAAWDHVENSETANLNAAADTVSSTASAAWDHVKSSEAVKAAADTVSSTASAAWVWLSRAAEGRSADSGSPAPVP